MKIFWLTFTLTFIANVKSVAQPAPATNAPAGRGQWSMAQAWSWNEKMGVIRGFNALGIPYPGFSETDVMCKVKSLGYNSLRTSDFFRLWLKSPEDAKHRLHRLLDEAGANGLTVLPVLLWGTSSIPGGRATLQAPDAQQWTDLKSYVQDMVGEFRNDDRIAMWDVLNEPDPSNEIDLRLARQMILWAREVNPQQPLTTSILWTGPEPNAAQIALEQLTDVHNFHIYDGSTNRMGKMEAMIRCLKNISNRPLVCTECLSRTQGDTFGRILPTFSKYHVHWYNWGLYTCDANWLVSWRRSSFDPYNPWFHDMLHPDGEPYDWRDLELIRTFHFAKPGENPDPGVEITDRWTKDRAWRWFVMGPLRGCTYRPAGMESWRALWMTNAAELTTVNDELAQAQAAGCDGLRARFDYDAWKINPKQFDGRVGDFLGLADRHGLTMTPVLLTDADAAQPVDDLVNYVSDVVKTFGCDGRIFCWELFDQPGASGLAKDQARSLLRAVFQAARFEFPGQPLTATPAVRVTEFAPDFDYRRALAHQGGLGNHGWDKLQYMGTGDASLCAYIWQLSDVLLFASNEKMPETGWLVSLANRYGRPVLCTEWTPGDAAVAEDTLKLFSVQHVRWFATGSDLSLAHANPAPSSNGESKTTLFQALGLFRASVLSGDENLARQVKQFHFQRVMTPPAIDEISIP
jgi:hypothetical protein